MFNASRVAACRAMRCVFYMQWLQAIMIFAGPVDLKFGSQNSFNVSFAWSRTWRNGWRHIAQSMYIHQKATQYSLGF